MKFKLVFTMFLGMVLSTIIAGNALADTSISGNSQVYPGRTYTYTVTVTENASTINGTVTTSGTAESQTKDWHASSSSGTNENITATCTITVTIPSSADIGSTGTIIVSGTGQKMDPDTHTATSFSIFVSKTVTVIAAPTPPSTAWEMAIEDIMKIEEDGSITVEMNPDDSNAFNIPIEVFDYIKTHKVILTVDYDVFNITIDGNLIGEIPDDIAEVNVGLTMQEQQRDSDMLVFDVNNQSELFYIAEYAVQPYSDTQEDLIYLYRHYENIDLMEYVNTASLDSEGNIIVKIFAPGSYIVSAVSIDGSEGNIEINELIEVVATPIPHPTEAPTPTAAPDTETTQAPDEESTAKVTLSVWIVAGILGGLIVILVIAVIVGISRQNKRQLD